MSRLPVIVGFGGVNSAGRSSFHQGYRRLLIDRLDTSVVQETYLNLATMVGLLTYDRGNFFTKDGNECRTDDVIQRFGKSLLENTLLRKISDDHFDVDRVMLNKPMSLQSLDHESRFLAFKHELPERIPSNWDINDSSDHGDTVEITINGRSQFYCPDAKTAKVQTAGQLPTGFDPGSLYPSRHQPRGLKMAVYGASDAIFSVGIDWQQIKDRVSPDEIGVYSSCAHGQMDEAGGGGLMKAHTLGRRTSSKQLSMSLMDMPSNFNGRLCDISLQS